MTKKDFILIAKVLKENNASALLVREMANALKTTNSLFDTGKFIAAADSVVELPKTTLKTI